MADPNPLGGGARPATACCPGGRRSCPNCDVELEGWEGAGRTQSRIQDDGLTVDRGGGSRALPKNIHSAEDSEWTRGKGLGKAEPPTSRRVDRRPMAPDSEPTVDWAPQSDSRAASARTRPRGPDTKVTTTGKDGRKRRVTSTPTLEEYWEGRSRNGEASHLRRPTSSV